MPRYTLNERVRVLDLDKPGHIRTPYYIRHQTGRIIQFCGSFLNPEDLATGNAGGRVVECYRVEFLQREVWEDYVGAPDDTIVIEIYEHWMEPATGKSEHA